MGYFVLNISRKNSNMLWFVETLIDCYVQIFKWKLDFQSKVSSNFWSNLIKTFWKVSTCDILVVNSSHGVKYMDISIFIVNVCWISNTRAADIIMCFRSICIQTVAFWLYLTFIQQFGASYPVLPSPTMCYNKNPADSNITKLLFCDSFRLIYYCKREQYLC